MSLRLCHYAIKERLMVCRRLHLLQVNTEVGLQLLVKVHKALLNYELRIALFILG